MLGTLLPHIQRDCILLLMLLLGAWCALRAHIQRVLALTPCFGAVSIPAGSMITVYSGRLLYKTDDNRHQRHWYVSCLCVCFLSFFLSPFAPGHQLFVFEGHVLLCCVVW